jgi:hypothetical protein
VIATLGAEMWLVQEDGAWVLCVPFARFSDGSGAPGIVDGTVRVLKEGTRVEVEG